MNVEGMCGIVGNDLSKWVLQSSARELLPNQGVAVCRRRLVLGVANVHVKHSPRKMRARYANLQTCKSVWVCPICSSRIAEQRRVELTQAIAKTKFSIALVTLTIQHTRAHTLKENISDLLKSYQTMKNSKGFRAMQKTFAMLGTIRATEITYTQANHWHTHFHVLTFFESKPNVESLRVELTELWQAALKKQGRFADDDHGVDVRTARGDVANYIAKFGHEPKSQWTIEHELTKSNSKTSRDAKGLAPFVLLADYNTGNKHSGKLFREFGETMKGKRQLWWSRGLRDRLGLSKEKTDAELADAKLADDEILLAQISREQWKAILAKELRGQVIGVCHSGDVAKLWAFLQTHGISLEV